MQLFLELGADQYCSNLPTIDKVAIIIPDEYKQSGFCNIILAYRNPKENNNQYNIINSNSAVYMLLYYMLFFPYSDLG